MADLEALVDEFSAKFELSNEDEQRLLSNVSTPSTIQAASPSTQSFVGVTPVSTFVAEKSFHNFAVPHFATHWGVVCDFQDDIRMLFHLLYNPSTRKMTFESSDWNEDWSKHSITSVGKTPYGFTKVNRIGCFALRDP